MIEKLKALFPDLNFREFGSRLTGLAAPKSDYDFILAVEEKDVDALKQRFERSRFGIKLGYDSKEMAKVTSGNGFDKSLNPGLYFVAQHVIFDPQMVRDAYKIDILVCTPQETERRLQTLGVISALVDECPEVVAYVRSIKGNNPAWAALHTIVDQAKDMGLFEGVRYEKERALGALYAERVGLLKKDLHGTATEEERIRLAAVRSQLEHAEAETYFGEEGHG